ncbi:MAG: JAB domain-containing protein [bacterium]
MEVVPYTIREHSGYIIHDTPPERGLPIRRLQSEGGEVLSTNELLQIALGNVDGMEEGVREYGSQFLTTLHSVNDIVESLHTDHLQATRLLAILALGKRLYAAEQGSMAHIRGIEDIYHHYRSMSQLAKEQLRVALINSRYQLVHEDTLAIGSVEYMHISPRDVFQAAVERRVTAIVLVHNHPSGDATPSQSDKEFTQEIMAAGKLLGIALLDHVIIGREGYGSCLGSEEH